MTRYRLVFKSQALKEWKKLGGNVREQFRKKLIERLEAPRVASAKLTGLSDCYKIKLRAAGFQLSNYIDHDEDLNNLRSDPRFRELRKQVRAEKN